MTQAGVTDTLAMTMIILNYTLYLGGGIGLRSQWLKKKDQTSRLDFQTNRQHSMGYLGLFIITILSAAAVTQTLFFSSQAWGYIDWNFLPHPWVGSAVLTLATLAILYCHREMGQAWSTGLVSDRNIQSLITHGPFRVSRNPIYTLVMTQNLGLFLSLPHMFTLLTLLLAPVLFSIVVRAEEKTLLTVHGQSYQEYMRKTPRWIGWSFRK